ncbi:hypothetical protein DY78_GL003077 [Lactiplantibacillus fabifermentans DSM 21115]|uniref:Uncharacterized protein n=1 Tax=Lactiplantibacillus fabifermentans DSM 21115 TaxID=1413187 RepID=A0A0R2NRU4_9LACO|nr:hypothetical protein DY78_GL003077 [Lactiplantibacillus fabifermentans DSM 21115]
MADRNEIVLKVALTDVFGPFTPRTSFETCFLGSKTRSQDAGITVSQLRQFHPN